VPARAVLPPLSSEFAGPVCPGGGASGARGSSPGLEELLDVQPHAERSAIGGPLADASADGGRALGCCNQIAGPFRSLGLGQVSKRWRIRSLALCGWA